MTTNLSTAGARIRYMRPMRNALVIALALALALALAACGKKDKDAASDKATPAAKATDGVGAKNGGVPTSREGQMFLLGQKLAQAAMVNGRAAPDVVARTFKAASTVANITLKTKLEPLPALTGDKAKDGAAGMAYLLNGPGKALGEQISTEFTPASAATYELAVKLNMLPMLYIDDPKDKMADTMAEVLGHLASAAKVDSAVAPLITKLKARAPMDEISTMALDLNKALPVAIAAVYEK